MSAGLNLCRISYCDASTLFMSKLQTVYRGECIVAMVQTHISTMRGL